MIFLAGCSQQQALSAQQEPTTIGPITNEPANNTTISYYLLNNPADSTNFCNGENMDSTGYKAALTKEITKTFEGKLTIEEKIKKTLALAVADSESFSETYALTANTTFENGIVTMHSANGWAGSSIFYCSWKPFVEKNLRFPEIKEIKWASEN